MGGAMVAAGAVAAAVVLDACATTGQGSSTAQPAPAVTGTKVYMQLYIEGIPVNKTSTALIQQFVDQSFNAKHAGIRATFQPQGNMAGVVSAVLAGSETPAVVSSCCADWPVIVPFLEKLDPYLKSDNVDIGSTWGAGQLARFQQPDGLYGLPEDAASDVYLYRQDILDQLGLEYPDPAWTAQEAQALWQACSGKIQGQANKWRFGTGCPFGPGTTEGLPTVVAGYGGSYMDATQTRCLLDQPGSIEAGNYWMQMVWNKVATDGDGSPNGKIKTGELVFTTAADPTVLYAVQQLGAGVKWDFIPWPVFPKRPVGKLHDNFYGMLANAKDKELAWEMLRWAAVDPDWQRFYMQLALTPPALPNLFDEWYTTLRATAPILKNKHLEYWAEPTLKGWGIYDNEFFRYSPTQANNIVNQVWPQIWNHQTTVELGFKQIADQINALEAVAAKEQGQAAAAAKQFPTTGPTIAGVQPGL